VGKTGAPERAPDVAGPGDTAVEELERALTGVARTILRLGVPPQALRDGEQIDRSGYWALVRLDESPTPVRLSDLAASLELDLSTVSRQVRDLVGTGLVTREPDPLDGRACLLSLSGRGRAVLDAVREARRDVLRDALSAWSANERATVAAAVARLAYGLHDAAPWSPAPETTRPQSSRAAASR